jgi:hypothetical protein
MLVKKSDGQPVPVGPGVQLTFDDSTKSMEASLKGAGDQVEQLEFKRRGTSTETHFYPSMTKNNFELACHVLCHTSNVENLTFMLTQGEHKLTVLFYLYA